MNRNQKVAYVVGVTAFVVLMTGGLIFGGRDWSFALWLREFDEGGPGPDPVGWLAPPAIVLAVTVAAVLVLKERRGEG